MSEEQREERKLLVSEDVYLTTGIQIGTTQKNSAMKRFTYKVRNDGLYVLDISQTDERLRTAAKFLSRYDTKDIMAVSSRIYGKRPVSVFSNKLGSLAVYERYVPGTLTNYKLDRFMEPKVVLLTDPAADAQVLREAVSVGIPVVAVCDTNNDTKYVDLVIPANNKGRRALAVVYWLLAREILKNKGVIASDEEFDMGVEDFEATL